MTSIRDISNNLIKTHDDYNKSRKEINIIIDKYRACRNKPSNVSLEDHSKCVYNHAIDYFKAECETKNLEQKFNRAHYLTSSHIKSFKITTRKMRSLHPEMCGVCMEYHPYRKIISTSCHHYFGKECLSNWIDMCFVNYEDVSCPLCRDTNFTVTRYTDKNHK